MNEKWKSTNMLNYQSIQQLASHAQIQHKIERIEQQIIVLQQSINELQKSQTPLHIQLCSDTDVEDMMEQLRQIIHSDE